MHRSENELVAEKLGIGVQNALDALLTVANSALLSYEESAAATLQAHVQAIGELRLVDRLLFVIVTGAGAIKAEHTLPATFSLTLARCCLQTYFVRRMFDFGLSLGSGIDPIATTEDADCPATTETRQRLSAAQRSIEAIRDQLKICLSHVENEYGEALPLSLELNEPLQMSLEQLANVSQSHFQELIPRHTRRIRAPSFDLLLELGGLEANDPVTRTRANDLYSAALTGHQSQLFAASLGSHGLTFDNNIFQTSGQLSQFLDQRAIAHGVDE
ncbi:MAG TPA: hypothetical protein VFK05_18480 [Polyangiaceae bacterium]|nr:hypothetical protein [Polyangiaceae bacterium]